MTQSDISKNENSNIAKLIPFIVTILLYFSLIYHTEPSTIPSTVLKCMPIYSLLFFVLLTDFKHAKAKQYKTRILSGLLFSSFGDLLLNYDLFEAGMGAFGMAQVFYILAFGMKPLKVWIGVLLYTCGFLATSLFYGNLNSVIKICLPFYAVLLLTMCWRSLARIENTRNPLKLICGLCCVLFVISDGIIAFDKFFMPINAAQTYIMITYYVAQVGIAFSINDFHTLDSTINTKRSPKTLYR
uniref:lysoplasmalogenase n=1 Tax=Anopheles atroparvus TaxID=41427 RepID=A0AAG5DRB3_ANOAO